MKTQTTTPTVYVFNKPYYESYRERADEYVGFVFESLITHYTSRFGWSYENTADLVELHKRSWATLNDDERLCFSRAKFLLDVKKGDWVVHIHVPKRGKCTAGQVVEPYKFDPNNNDMRANNVNGEPSPYGDFRHTLKLDPRTIITFDRNNQNILPHIQRSLKPRRHFQRMSDAAGFLTSLSNI